MSESNKEIVKKVNASFEKNDLETFLSACAENVEWNMVGDRTTKGADNIREWMNSMGEMEPPKINLSNAIAEGETVAAYGDMTMKNDKGETVPYEFCDVYEFENGKIAKLTSYVVKIENK